MVESNVKIPGPDHPIVIAPTACHVAFYPNRAGAIEVTRS